MSLVRITLMETSCLLNAAKRSIFSWVAGCLFTIVTAAADDPIKFNRDIRPILSDKCLHCHGADENTRDADLRLDDPADVRSDRGGYQVVVSGEPSDSELYLRIVLRRRR